MSGAVPVLVKVRQFAHAAGLPLPRYETEGSAGLDLVAAIDADRPLALAPFGRALIPTGLAIALPKGFEAQIRPRSGLALKNGLSILNSPGTIDCDYRGEIGIIIINLGENVFNIARGMRIAQLVVAPVARAEFDLVSVLDDTERGDGGFGSTGSEANAG